MGATCSNCNCNRDERDNELKIDGQLAGGNGASGTGQAVSSTILH